jgi:hypothetical protein
MRAGSSDKFIEHLQPQANRRQIYGLLSMGAESWRLYIRPMTPSRLGGWCFFPAGLHEPTETVKKKLREWTQGPILERDNGYWIIVRLENDWQRFQAG